MNKKWKWAVLYTGIGAVTAALNVTAWNSTAFCDGYIKYVFPVWVNSYGRITGLFPFSVGEILLGLAAVLAAAALVLWIPFAVIRAGILKMFYSVSWLHFFGTIFRRKRKRVYG